MPAEKLEKRWGRIADRGLPLLILADKHSPNLVKRLAALHQRALTRQSSR
jgi:hypothetical protein